jgi:hypothetical protein
MYKYEPHVMKYVKCLRREVCVKCGLLNLNNSFTQWSIKMGCESKEHPDYKEQMRKGAK